MIDENFGSSILKIDVDFEDNEKEELQEKLRRACVFGQKAIQDSHLLNEKVTMLEQEKKELLKEINRKNASYDELEEMYSDVRVQKNELSVVIEELRDEVSILKKTKSVVEAELQKVLGTSKKLKDLLKNAKNDRYYLKKRNTICLARIDSDKSILRTLKKRHKRLKRRLSVVITPAVPADEFKNQKDIRRNSFIDMSSRSTSITEDDYDRSEYNLNNLSDHSIESMPGECETRVDPTKEELYTFLRKRSKSTDYFACTGGLHFQARRASRRDSIIGGFSHMTSRKSSLSQQSGQSKGRKKSPIVQNIQESNDIYSGLGTYSMNSSPNSNSKDTDLKSRVMNASSNSTTQEDMEQFMNIVKETKEIRENQKVEYDKLKEYSLRRLDSSKCIEDEIVVKKKEERDRTPKPKKSRKKKKLTRVLSTASSLLTVLPIENQNVSPASVMESSSESSTNSSFNTLASSSYGSNFGGKPLNTTPSRLCPIVSETNFFERADLSHLLQENKLQRRSSVPVLPSPANIQERAKGDDQMKEAEIQLRVIQQLGLLDFYNTLQTKEVERKEEEKRMEIVTPKGLGWFSGKKGYLLCTKQKKLLGKKFGWTTYVKYFILATENVLVLFFNENCEKIVDHIPYSGTKLVSGDCSMEILLEANSGKVWVVRETSLPEKEEWLKIIKDGIENSTNF